MMRREGHSPLCPASPATAPIELCTCGGGSVVANHDSDDRLAGGKVGDNTNIDDVLNAGAFSGGQKHVEPQIPSINRVVQYCMTETDVDRAKRELRRDGRHGNMPRAGELYPAMIVKVFGDTPGAAFNVQVLLDGNFSLWVTSTNITTAPKPRHCIWPPRV